MLKTKYKKVDSDEELILIQKLGLWRSISYDTIIRPFSDVLQVDREQKLIALPEKPFKLQ